MLKQTKSFAPAATLPPEKSILILENLIAQAEELRPENWTSPKREQWIHTSEGALLSALDASHPSIRAFGAARFSVVSSSTTDAELQLQGNDELDSMVSVLKSSVEQLHWQLPDPTQIFLPAGSAHDAYVEIRKIITLATSEILIADSYVDGTLWALLTNVQAAAKISIMTMQMKADFALEGRKFAAQHGNVIEVRKTSQYHDRFILVDWNRCWHLLASIKDAGNKASIISEVLSPSICSAIKTDVGSTWYSATLVPLEQIG